MARPLRLAFPGAVYHVMARGNHGQKILADDKDRHMWLAALAQAVGRVETSRQPEVLALKNKLTNYGLCRRERAANCRLSDWYPFMSQPVAPVGCTFVRPLTAD